MEKIVEIKCIEHVYNDKTTVELCGLDFFITRGEKVAILGPNGGGKTTLIKHILGLLKPNTGEIKVFGVDPIKNFNVIRQKIGVVLQSVDEQLIGPTVLDDILFTPLNYNVPEQEALKMAYDVMESFEITHLKDKIIHYLSGGEKRKVALAGAMILNPELLILDEPFSALDVKSQVEFIKIINKISAEHQITVVLTTHDVELVSDFADTVFLISSGNKLSQKGTPKEIFMKPELLAEFNLQPPSIVRLFEKLKKDNIDIGTPANVDEAFKILKNYLSSECKV